MQLHGYARLKIKPIKIKLNFILPLIATCLAFSVSFFVLSTDGHGRSLNVILHFILSVLVEN